MGLKDLEGKRSGRPPGARSTSRVKRDILWAYRNLDKPDAKSPSAGARMWAEHARRDPGHFLACVLRADTAGQSDAEAALLPKRDVSGGPSGNGTTGKIPQKVKNFFIGGCHLLGRLTRDGSAWISNLPGDAEVVGCKPDPSRDGVILTIFSESFRPIPEGEVIPELTVEYARS
jgi:hypothetical protein